MNSRRRSTVNALAGVVLAGGALSAILYWNYHPTNVARATVPSPVTVAEPARISTTVPVAAAPNVMAGAEALVGAKALAGDGRLVEARQTLNDALVAGSFAGGDEADAKGLLSSISEKLVFGPTVYPGDPLAETITIKKGDLLMKVANQYLIPHDLILQINHVASAKKIRVGQQLKVIKGPFHAVVSKSAFTLDLYLGAPGGAGSTYVTTYRVGLGANDSTPTGMWKITPENKIREPNYYSPRGEGIIPPGPTNPLGHYWLGLTGVDGQAVGKTSYGIHGTIDPGSIGKQSSMGCIRLADGDIARVFATLFEGKSTVRVVE